MELVELALAGTALASLALAAWAYRHPRQEPSTPTVQQAEITPAEDWTDPNGPPTAGEHIFPRVDVFDGLWETWICRHCGEHHRRMRP